MMGCSNPHPHGQVWSMSDIPSIPLKELSALKRYASAGVAVENGLNNISELPCLLCDYAGLEESSVRLVLKNDYWLAIVPWWATWPFEILCELVTKKRCSYICNKVNFLLFSVTISARKLNFGHA